MAIGDAGKLGEAISMHEGNLEAALQEYQQERMAQTAKEVRPYATAVLRRILYVTATLPLLLHQLNAAMPCCERPVLPLTVLTLPVLPLTVLPLTVCPRVCCP